MSTDAKITRRRWLQNSTALGLAAANSSWLTGVAEADGGKAADVTDIGSRLELFVDEALIGKLSGGATVRLHHPTPQEVAIVHDQPWEGTGSGYHTVFQDGDRYRMYYRGWHLDVSEEGKLSTGRHPLFYCYAASRDGIKWDKPELGLVEFAGSKKNNIFLQGLGTHNFAPLKDGNPTASGEAPYKALAGVKSEGGLFAFGSPDGVRWSLLQKEPVITNGAFDSQNLAFWDPTIGKYRAYWRTFTEGVTTQKVWKPAGVRAVRTATSDDFIHWENEADLTYVDSPAEHLYTNQVNPYFRAPHILIGLPTRYVDRGWSDSTRALPDLQRRELRSAAHQRYGTAVTEGLLMASRDGVKFRRWNEAFLRPGIGRPGTWQYGQQYIANHLVETASSLPGAPNELSLYATEDYWHGKGGSLRRYTLRLDGFVSIQAPMKGGSCVTKPVKFDGSQLTLNFATSAAGGVRIEIQELDGKPIEGFTLEDCPAHFGDDLQRVVTWKNGSDVSQLSGRPVRLHFELKDADVYAFQFSKA